MLLPSVVVSICFVLVVGEGSRNLFPNSGTCSDFSSGGACRPNLDWRTDSYGPTGHSVLRRTLFYVYANFGEVILVGSSSFGHGKADIVMFAPGQVNTSLKGNEDLSVRAGQSCASFTGVEVGTGQIQSRTQELSGPFNQGGFIPCVFNVSATGIYNIAIIGTAGPDANIDGKPTGELNLASTVNFNPVNDSTVAAWDITVRPSIASKTDLNGRVFTYVFSAFSARNWPLYVTLYAATSDGYQYQVSTVGMAPNALCMFASHYGFIDPAVNYPLYHDIRTKNNELSILTNSSNGNTPTFARPDFPLFITPPAATTLVVLGFSTTPLLGTIYEARNVVGQPFYPSSTGSGNLIIGSNVSSYTSLVVSNGTDFDPTRPTNRLFQFDLSTSSTQTLSFLDNSGTAFPAGFYKMRITQHFGEIHFPLLDIESNLAGGPKLTLRNAPCPNFAGGCNAGFYDDRGYRIQGGTIGTWNGALCTSPNSAPPPTVTRSDYDSGFDTSTTQRSFGLSIDQGTDTGVDCVSPSAFGDGKGLDLWTFTPSNIAEISFWIIDAGAKGFIFFDGDQNGSQNSSELGLAGVVITANNGTFTKQVLSDQNGYYALNLGPSAYQFSFSASSGVCTTNNCATSYTINDQQIKTLPNIGMFVPPTPATAQPTTKQPSTRLPTTIQPTSQPVGTVYKAPTVRPPTVPVALVTSSPTRAPTICSTCSATINGSSGNSTQVILGDPGSEGVVVNIPSSLFNYSNSSNVSVIIVLTPFSSGPDSMQTPGGTSVLTINVSDSGIMRENSTQLEVPLVFLMPYSAEALACEKVAAQCVWWSSTLKKWVDSGCTALATPLGTQCSCSHLTDFAVLLDETRPCHQAPSSSMYYCFVALYGVLLLYCVVTASRMIIASAVDKHLFPSHIQVGLVAALRILSCLRFALGSNPWFLAVVAALPYPLEFWLFMRLAASWILIVHYAFMGEARSWQKIRPVFWVLFALGSLAALALFVLFAIEASLTAAIAGTAVLSTCYLLLAIAFQLYAYLLAKELGGLNTSNKAVSINNRGLSVHTKIKWAGRVVASCFVLQALTSVLALVMPPSDLETWTTVYLSFNVLALSCLLVLYFGGVQKAVAKNQGYGRQNSTTSVAMSSRNIGGSMHRAESDLQPL